MKKFTVTHNSTLKEFTDSTYAQGSFVFTSLLKKGDIRINGEKVHTDRRVFAGDEVVYYTAPSQEAKQSYYPVYDDVNVFVADKPANVSSEALFSELAAKGVASYPVHRLDRNTQGLIILAKNPPVQEELIKAFREHRVSKIYFCLTKNGFKKDKDILTAYLKKDEKSGKVRIYPDRREDTVKIVTEYEVLRYSGDFALVKVTLHTGKTHQIRAHLAYIGCPVLGDTKYGDFALNKKYSATRQILVAKYLKFEMRGGMSYLNAIPFESTFFPRLPVQ